MRLNIAGILQSLFKKLILVVKNPANQKTAREFCQVNFKDPDNIKIFPELDPPA